MTDTKYGHYIKIYLEKTEHNSDHLAIFASTV